MRMITRSTWVWDFLGFTYVVCVVESFELFECLGVLDLSMNEIHTLELTNNYFAHLEVSFMSNTSSSHLNATI